MKKSHSFLLGVVVALLLAGGVFWWWPSGLNLQNEAAQKVNSQLKKAGTDEDDRPPIIVSNGSIKIETGKHENGGQGIWSPVSGSSKPSWYHDYQNSTKPAKPTKFDVFVSGVGPDSMVPCHSSNYFVQRLTTLTVNYLDPKSKPHSLTIDLAQTGLEIVAESGVNAAASGYLLELETKGWQLKSVDLGKNAAGAIRTCSFSGSKIPPQIVILQRQQ